MLPQVFNERPWILISCFRYRASRFSFTSGAIMLLPPDNAAVFETQDSLAAHQAFGLHPLLVGCAGSDFHQATLCRVASRSSNCISAAEAARRSLPLWAARASFISNKYRLKQADKSTLACSQNPIQSDAHPEKGDRLRQIGAGSTMKTSGVSERSLSRPISASAPSWQPWFILRAPDKRDDLLVAPLVLKAMLCREDGRGRSGGARKGRASFVG